MGDRRWLWIVGVLLANVSWVLAAEPERPRVSQLPPLPIAVRDALEDRRFGPAIEIIDSLLTEKKTGNADYLLYLKGRAETELERYDEALATFAKLEAAHPESPWLSRSRFGRGLVLARRKDYAGAGVIYRAETERLLSAGRRDELAGIYLEFADRHFKGQPGPKPVAPDYAQAFAYYEKALEIRPSLPLRQQIELRMARCHLELKQYPQSVALYQQFLTAYTGPTRPAAERAAAALEAEARFQLGRAQLIAGQPADARKTWQDLLVSAAGKEAGEGLLPEAMFELAHTYAIPAPPSVRDLELGVAALQRFLKAYPGHAQAPQAEFEIAQSYSLHKRFSEAIAALQSLIENPQYAGKPQVSQAWYLLGQDYRLQGKSDAAIATWRRFLDQFPSDPHWSEVQKLIIDTEFALANEQRVAKNYAAARKLWETFLNKYPLDARAPAILMVFAEMQFDEARELLKKAKPDAKPTAETTKIFESAIADWRRLVSKYPGTAEANQAAYRIGLTLEEDLGRLTEALEAYKQAQAVNQAATPRIMVLTAPQLEVVTQRKFRGDEPARIQVTTRNLEKVTVKLYRIDLADYFRKMHLAGGVENLDIALIDPDQTFEHKVEKYEQYRRLENAVTIPLEGPGVTAVTVASETLEATTMVLVSDIDIIVKASRNELFVFAENMRTGKPAEGVSLLISDGEKIFAEEATGKDGVLQKSYKPLETISDLRVFAAWEGHSASSTSSLVGLNFAVGLAPKGYVYTDRPAYRAGQTVHVKGLIRWVAGDQYTFKAGEKYQLELFDSRGRVLHTRQVVLGEFGTFAQHFALPDTAPVGEYRLHLFQPNGTQDYAATFSVHAYQLEPVQLLIELPRKVYFRGEPVQGKFTLQYYYGTPLAGRKLEYQLGERVYTAETDAKGQVAFDLPTEGFSESQRLALEVRYPERNITASEPLQLATHGFDIGLSTIRSVYVTGETFDAKLSVVDPLGKPLGVELKLEIFEETQAGAQKGERLVQTLGLKADEKTGSVTQTLRLEHAGRHILRATATDRFGNRISGSHRVLISGDDDTVRLRILADQHYYKVGDTAGVTLHWREPAALALVTYEGGAVLGYQLVPLKTGANKLDIPLAGKLAPNFELAVCVMHGNKFHEARSDFRVSRGLRIALRPSATELAPGAPLTVDVIVTDAQGKPVSAELSLGLVQKNLLALFAGNTEAVDEFFGTGLRTVCMQAASSCTFRYHPRTHGISESLLAESKREETDKLERDASERLGRKMQQQVGRNLFGDPGAEAWNALTANRKKWASGDQPEEALVAAFDELMSQRRWAEAEVFARKLAEQFPGNPMAESMNWKARFAQRVASNEQLSKGNEEGFWNALDEVDHAAATIVGAALPLRLYGVWGDTSREQLSFVGKIDMNGDGTDDRQLLSLIINQTQTVHDEVKLHYQLNQYSDVLALNAGGIAQVLNGLPPAALAALAKEGLQIVAGGGQAETGYWNPVVVTDKTGKARLEFMLPDRATAWRLQAKGIDAGAETGQAEVEIRTRQDLFGELKLPLAFTAGDKPEILAEVHHSGVKEGEPLEVVLKTTLGEKTTELKKQLKAGPAAIDEVRFAADIGPADEAVFELTVTSGERKHVSRRTLPVLPDGLPVFATKSGTSAQSTGVSINHEKALVVEQPSLEIVIGPSVNRTLLDAVLGAALTKYESSFGQPVSGFERSISDVLGGVSLLRMIGQTRTTDTPEAQALVARIDGGLSQIISAQRDDGAWGWAGMCTGERADRYQTSRAVWALAAARKAGFPVPQPLFDKGVAFLQSAFVAASESDDEGKAIILYGLAEAGVADFAHANRLYRSRQNLSVSGLLHTALALNRLDRRNMAQDLLELVPAKLPLEPAPVKVVADPAAKQVIPWMSQQVELQALYLVALNETTPGAEQAGKIADWLLAQRSGGRWQPEKANGPVLIALGEWFGRAKVANEKYTLSVFVNDKLVEKLDVDPSKQPSRRVAVPARLLAAGPQRINFELEGRGTFSYSAVLGGFVPSAKLANTTDNWRVIRSYEPAQRMLDGELIPRGFSVLKGAYSTFRNELTSLPLGERGEVLLILYRNGVKGTKDEQLDYLVLTEPLPAGTSVLPESIKGGFERYEITPGAITFYIGDRANLSSINYTLVGYLPGNYRTIPSLVRSFYQPSQIAVSAVKPLTVLPRGEPSTDVYKLSPVELYEFGKRFTARRDYAAAAEHLEKLFTTYSLQDAYYREVVEMLFQSALARNQADAIVQYFEIIKEKLPEIEVPFDSILKVGAAYQKLGEYERGYLVYRATAEASFERESQIAGFLDGRGEFLRSVQVMERLLREYPAESYIATATYALAQEVYGKAPEAANDAKLRDAKITRVDLIATAIEMLDHFLAAWPLDPAADQASFSLATALLDLEKFEAAIERAARFAERYPESRLLDSFWYVIGYSRFARGEPDQALEMCRKVAEAKRRDPQSGNEVAADNKWQAIYIMGQIYHSLGKPAEAIKEYQQVETQFPDAAEAIQFFTHQEIQLPEVTTVKPGEEAKVELKFRNVPEANLKVYRIDLLKFGLLQRNLSRITAINLAGIRPYHELSLKLGDGRDYRDREQQVQLPLKDEGAYLVVCRGGSLYASGLVLVSPLALEIQEDAPAGRIRVTVRNIVQDRYEHGVHAKVIGSGNSQFVSGDTDLRGIFIADGIVGTGTVIARSGENRYAFYRGKTVLGPTQAPEKSEAQTPAAPPAGQEDLLKNIRGTNGYFQQEQRQNYRNLLDNSTQGVKSKLAQ